MKKNRFLYVSMLMMALLGSMVATSCGDDEEEVGKKEVVSHKIQGMWKYAFGDEDFIVMFLNADSTGYMIEYDNGEIDKNKAFTYNYNAETNLLTVYWDTYQDKAVVQWINEDSFRWNFDGDKEIMIWNRQILDEDNADDAEGDGMDGMGGTASLICPDDNHPHIIDLGLPSGTKWCCCNVDATAPEEFGGYYAWGETSEKSVYDENTYAYFDNNTAKYINIGSYITGTSYDVAHVKMGDSWCMPTNAQLTELIFKNRFSITSYNGVRGLLITGQNKNQLFLPFAGKKRVGYPLDAGDDFFYWAGNVDEENIKFAYDFYFTSYGAGISDWRYIAHSVRPVHK